MGRLGFCQWVTQICDRGHAAFCDDVFKCRVARYSVIDPNSDRRYYTIVGMSYLRTKPGDNSSKQGLTQPLWRHVPIGRSAPCALTHAIELLRSLHADV
jgi:hypothetical protein